jgi:hypothetical protein
VGNTGTRGNACIMDSCLSRPNEDLPSACRVDLVKKCICIVAVSQISYFCNAPRAASVRILQTSIASDGPGDTRWLKQKLIILNRRVILPGQGLCDGKLIAQY